MKRQEVLDTLASGGCIERTIHDAPKLHDVVLVPCEFSDMSPRGIAVGLSLYGQNGDVAHRFAITEAAAYALVQSLTDALDAAMEADRSHLEALRAVASALHGAAR